MSIMRLTTVFSVAISVGILAASVSAAGPDPGVNVTVTNPPTHPIPVTGTLGVTVNNNSPLPVTVTTTSTPVAFLMASSGGDPGKPPNIVAVPSNKRLTIEYISGLCHPTAVAVGKAINMGDMELVVTTSGVTNSHRVNIPVNPLVYDQNLGGGGQTDLKIGHLVKIYADPATNITLKATDGECHLVLSGQFTPL